MGTTFKRIDENRNIKNTQATTRNFCTWQLNNLKPFEPFNNQAISANISGQRGGTPL